MQIECHGATVRLLKHKISDWTLLAFTCMPIIAFMIGFDLCLCLFLCVPTEEFAEGYYLHILDQLDFCRAKH